MTKHPELLCSPSETMLPPQKAKQNLCRTQLCATVLFIVQDLYLGTITHLQVEYHLLLVRITMSSQFSGDKHV